MFLLRILQTLHVGVFKTLTASRNVKPSDTKKDLI